MPVTKVKGSNVCLFTGTTTKKVFAASTDCKLSVTMGTIKTSNKDSGDFEESMDGLISWNMTSDNMKTTNGGTPDAALLTYDEVVDMILAKTIITVTIGETTGVLPHVLGTGKGLVGTAWITKCDDDNKSGDISTFSVTLEGTGIIAPVAG